MSTTTNTNTSSFTSVLAGLNRKLATGKYAAAAAMEIELDNHHHYSTKAYASGSRLSGRVVVRPARDTRFDSLHILLMGVTKTRVDGVHAPHATQHTFLRLAMPILEASYPVPRVYEAGRVYTVPFHFVIPSYLTLGACCHKVESDAVSGHHLCMPPSLGTWDKDDMAPGMARVEYTVRARLYREEELDKTRTKILEANQRLSLHHFQDQVHAEVDPVAQDGQGHSDRVAAGRHHAEPGRQHRDDDERPDRPPVRGFFFSSSGQSPSAAANMPRVTEVTSKISAMTFFGGSAMRDFPNMGNWVRTYGAEGRGSYTYNMALGSTAVDELELGSLRQPTMERLLELLLIQDKLPVYHTASLQVPINIPAHKKTFAPTFHSCIASRVYVLWLTVSVSSCGGSSTSKTTLAVPLQIGVEEPEAPGADGEGPRPPSFEAAMEEAEAEEHLRPRTLYVPEVEFERHALPGYGDSMEWRTSAGFITSPAIGTLLIQAPASSYLERSPSGSVVLRDCRLLQGYAIFLFQDLENMALISLRRALLAAAAAVAVATAHPIDTNDDIKGLVDMPITYTTNRTLAPQFCTDWRGKDETSAWFPPSPNLAASKDDCQALARSMLTNHGGHDGSTKEAEWDLGDHNHSNQFGSGRCYITVWAEMCLRARTGTGNATSRGRCGWATAMSGCSLARRSSSSGLIEASMPWGPCSVARSSYLEECKL
ncbi:arrestin [Apiospora hydei]|uniref:Arrestin n=1 Tax=Apiospora hydei TaxID=1337664 RepID=A0ABR1W810_9PEZI